MPAPRRESSPPFLTVSQTCNHYTTGSHEELLNLLMCCIIIKHLSWSYVLYCMCIEGAQRVFFTSEPGFTEGVISMVLSPWVTIQNLLAKTFDWVTKTFGWVTKAVLINLLIIYPLYNLILFCSWSEYKSVQQIHFLFCISFLQFFFSLSLSLEHVLVASCSLSLKLQSKLSWRAIQLSLWLR